LQGHSKHGIDEVHGDQTVREVRWPEGIAGPSCQSQQVIQRGVDAKALARQRSARQAGATRFEDLTETLVTGHHHPLNVWVLWLSCRGLCRSVWRCWPLRPSGRRQGQRPTRQGCCKVVFAKK